MASLIAEHPPSHLEVVDLTDVHSTELSELWSREARLWRVALDWDVSGAISALARAVDRGGLTGKAVRCGARTLGYAYYAVEGQRGVISGLMVSPETPAGSAAQVGSLLVQSVVDELYRRRVRRIETQFIGFEAPWLTTSFEERGFDAYWREFLRVSVRRPRPSAPRPPGILIAPWSSWNLSEMAELMHRAHRGGVDAAMNELYRTTEGCRVLLHNIVRQRGCGNSLAAASSIARRSTTDEPAGFAVVTEIGVRHGHLAQIAVAPGFQGRGVGRHLLEHSLTRLSEVGLDALSLMVSTENRRAAALYRALGFAPVYRFPVFSREL